MFMFVNLRQTNNKERTNMDRSILRSKWDQFKTSLPGYWDDFTNEEVDQINGDWDLLVHELQKKYAFSRSEAENEIQYFMLEVDDHVYDEIYKEKILEEVPY
jgi:hypothetical protein